METKNQGDHYLSSLKNALRILNSFSMDEPEKKITEISSSLGLNKSTVSRTMATLASEGFVFKDPETKKYRLGLSILTLSGVVNSTMDIYRESQPILNKLVETLGETAHISVLDHLDVIYLHKVECNHPVRYLTHVGRRNPPYCTSSGKVLLAFSGEDVINSVIEKGLHRFSKNTITDPERLHDHLREVNKNGYALSVDELLDGATSIAAPIYDYNEKVIAALSIVGPKQRLPSHKIPGIAKKVMSAGLEISRNMGYRKVE
jgi:IclR family transcriptional regulator, KDG regulon repressor